MRSGRRGAGTSRWRTATTSPTPSGSNVRSRFSSGTPRSISSGPRCSCSAPAAGRSASARRLRRTPTSAAGRGRGSHSWQPTFVGRLEWFREHRYDPRRRRAQDQELLVRTCATSRFANLPEILAGYREETISLAKSWRGRLQGAIGFAAEYLRRRRPDLAALAFGLAAAKGLVDTFAVASGLGYRVLRHRARPLAADELAQWREVWRMLGEEECDAR